MCSNKTVETGVLFDQCLSLITAPLHRSFRVGLQIQELKRDIGTRKSVPSECLVERDA